MYERPLERIFARGLGDIGVGAYAATHSVGRPALDGTGGIGVNLVEKNVAHGRLQQASGGVPIIRQKMAAQEFLKQHPISRIARQGRFHVFAQVRAALISGSIRRCDRRLARSTVGYTTRNGPGAQCMQKPIQLLPASVAPTCAAFMNTTRCAGCRGDSTSITAFM